MKRRDFLQAAAAIPVAAALPSLPVIQPEATPTRLPTAFRLAVVSDFGLSDLGRRLRVFTALGDRHASAIIFPRQMTLAELKQLHQLEDEGYSDAEVCRRMGFELSPWQANSVAALGLLIDLTGGVSGWLRS